MTTSELLQRYPSHKEIETKAFDSSKPELTMSNSDPSQYFDSKTRLLHGMLDKVVQDLANSESEPASEWDGTLWRSPLRPRSRSPAYSEISDSFESPGRIEHCTNDILSTPISPTSTQFRGPDGWPLGIEVAMNDFHRGRLSTSSLHEEELPNRLILRKQKQQVLCFGGSGNPKAQETVRCGGVSFQCESQRPEEGVVLRPLAFQKQQTSVLPKQYGKGQYYVENSNLKPRASQQQCCTGPGQQSDGQFQHDSVHLRLPKLQQPSGGEGRSDNRWIPTPSARIYDGGEDEDSLRNASTDLHSLLTNDNVPMGLDSENSALQLSINKSDGKEHHASHIQINAKCLNHTDCRQTVLSNASSALPRNERINGTARQAELQISTLDDASDRKTDSPTTLSAVDNTGLESTDCEIDCHNTLENSGKDICQTIETPRFEDGNASTDSDAVSWKISGLLEDILEETEDLLANTLTLDEGQPRYCTLGSGQPLNSRKSGWACEKGDSMFAFPGSLTKPSAPLSSPPRVPPTLKLTINPSTNAHLESTKLSRPYPSDVDSSLSTMSAATVVGLRDLTRKEGRLPLSALVEMRETARSQPHFQTGPDAPEDQSQAQIHPLLRSKSRSRPSSQPDNIIQDSALKYVFKDDNSKSHDVKDEDSVGYQITLKPCSSFEAKVQNAKSSITHAPMKEHTSLQAGEIIEGTIPRYLYRQNDTEGHEAEYAETFTPQGPTLRSSDDTTLVPSLKNLTSSSSFIPTTSPSTMNGLSSSAPESPDAMTSSTLQPLILPAMTGYCLNSAIASPAAYNSWASTPHHHEHGSSCSTPSPAAKIPSSTVSTSNTTLCSNSPISCGVTMTPASSLGHFTGNLPTSCVTNMTPSSSLGQFPGTSPDFRGISMTPSSSLGDIAAKKKYRRSVSFSSMFARYRKAQYPDLPTAATTDSILSSKDSAEWDQAREVMIDPFTSNHDSSTPFSLIIKAPSKENLADIPTRETDRFTTPTRRSSGRFSLPRRSLSTSGRPHTNEGLERALSSLIFNPHCSRPQEGSETVSAHLDCTKKLARRGSRHRRSLSIATNNANQTWEVAPPPTPLCLRDEFSMRYRPEPLEAHDHYATRKDSFHGMKQGLRKVFGRQ